MRDEPQDGKQDPKHPIGRGVGAVGGTIAGAAAGTAAGGPVGTAVGAVIGAVAGGLAGNGIAELVNPEDEDRYWREQHKSEPYYVEGTDYEAVYAPAYRLGWESRVKYHGMVFEDAEPEMKSEYEQFHGNDMTWLEIRPAARAAWDRVDERVRSFNGN
jgi:uncharacterized protein YcfJ